MRNQILASALGAAVTLLVAALVLDDGPGLGPQVVILGIVGAMLGWLAVKVC
ncbi:hypothetical protein [Nocardioides panaciterrulae]|uniref:Uncharacterized protein n=1 Tax=Nocardioides panaciterrulae TaxID=661492 RepID=A0A7Y9E8J6_9ACTN|nr:hypothetical protein [Nocardioides panaciterrulae]NYD43198.1 hypothetical protein [Nocardioides panaciterrulae]